MRIQQKARPLAVAIAMASMVAGVGYAGTASADDQALAEQVKLLMKKVEDLTNQVQALKGQPAAAPAASAKVASGPAPAASTASAEPKFDAFLKGFYGTLDVSFDSTSKGMGGMEAFHLLPDNSGIDPTNPKGAAFPVGRVGYMPALSTNKSQIGYRGSHKIGDSDTNFVYQVETSLAITSSPGLKTSQYQQSNVVNGGIGLGDTFIGFQNKGWGRVKFGTFYSPYKKSTDRMNPFSGMLGDYAVVMGNSGGDNRVEFGTRLDHSFAWESPLLADMWKVNVLISPGQNRTYNNVVQSSGSPDCNGGNMPGSGNLFLNCDDGGFSDAFSANIEFEYEGFYATAAYELHKNVNRNSDGIGANNPTYGSFGTYTTDPISNLITGCTDTTGVLDCASFNNYLAEYPLWGNYGSPAYLNDIGDEAAYKFGVQYKFGFGLTVSGIWERMTRSLPQILEFQNERQRNGSWIALSQDLTEKDNVSIGWAHAGATPGDPGGQHNYNPAAGADTADMYTAAWKHRLDKQLYWYVDFATTINHGNAHYDIGAGGRGLTTDCHDGTNATYIDQSSAGNTTWGGCHPIGFSTGVNYKF